MIPTPTPSLVINYSYLWNQDAKKGHENGTKNRPCVIVSASPTEDGTNVMVVPITHQKQDIGASVPIPAAVAEHLKLDGEESHIVCTEMNHFIWPGFDLSPLQTDSGEFSYGFIPPKLFDNVKEKILVQRTNKNLRLISRN